MPGRTTDPLATSTLPGSENKHGNPPAFMAGFFICAV